MKIININIFISILFTIVSCNSPTEPPIDNTPPGKRDYKWSIDSVDYGNRPSTIQLESIWGSSSTDVWGANGDAPDVRDCLWHYDGVKWSRATDGTPITEATGNKVVYAVWGSVKNNVWAFGRKINQNVLSAFIMHYDGSQWIDATPANVNSLSSDLYNAYGTAENDIWVGGYEYALHYDGSKWTVYKVADSISVGTITGNNKYIYLSAYSPWGKNIRYLYKLTDNKFTIVDQSNILKFGLGLWASQQYLITFANGVISTDIKIDGSININDWHRELTTTTFIGGAGAYCIQSSKNVFAVGQWNLIYQYNGTDWSKININVPNHTVDPYALFWGVWTDGNEIFICDTQNGIIYHGK